MQKLKKPDRPMLSDIRVDQFKKGNNLVKCTTKLSEETWKDLDYIKAKHHVSEQPLSQSKPRGVLISKKQDMINNLRKFMPASRLSFWNNLPTSEVNDLVDNLDYS